ncbi:MAG TPA: hypothetical protein VHM91_06630 [Verrucomicrobiales bacterium]|nr:hypothetical protein [Verrucomicrobiales bacterium]
MKSTPLVIVSAGVLCIFTGFAAYHLGKNQEAAHPAPGSSAPLRTSAPAPSTSGHSPVKEQAKNPFPEQSVLAGIKEKIRAGGDLQNPVTLAPIMGLMEKIRPEDIPEVLAEIEGLTDTRQKTALLMSLLGKWAAVDGAAAMDYADKHTGETGAMASVLKGLIARVWTEKDPEAVWQWYQQHGKGETGGNAADPVVLAPLFSRMAASDPGKAFSRLQEFDGAARAMALTGIFQSASDPDQRRALLQMANSLPDESERIEARKTMAGQWMMTSPDEATAWVKEQSAQEQAALRESTGNMLMMSDPKKAAAFILEGATGEELPGRYGSVILKWATRDINAAGTWLREQPQGPQLDEARRMFVTVASQKDPGSAMAWAGTITDSFERAGAVTMAWQAWQKTDPAAADRALAGTNLTEEQKNAVRSSTTSTNTSPAAPVRVQPKVAPSLGAP